MRDFGRAGASFEKARELEVDLQSSDLAILVYSFEEGKGNLSGSAVKATEGADDSTV